MFSVGRLVNDANIPLSRLIRNVPFYRCGRAEHCTGHRMSRVGGAVSPFPPAYRLIELDGADLPVLRFPKKIRARMASERPSATRSTDSIPHFGPHGSCGNENSQRSFHAGDPVRRRYLYFFRPGRFSVILSPRMILTWLARLGEACGRSAGSGFVLPFPLSGQRCSQLLVG
jgi:hypothetical protein